MSFFDISYVSEMALSKQQEADITSLIRTCFPADYGGRTFYQQRHHYRILAHQNNELICHVAAQMRAVRLGENIVDVVGLAEVGTMPAARGKGCATACVQMAIDEAKKSPADFVMLFGTENIYREIGFIHQTNPITYIPLLGCQTGEVTRITKSALMVLPLGDRQWDAAAELDVLGHLI